MISSDLKGPTETNEILSQDTIRSNRLWNILVVDDEETILSIMEKFLEDYGYTTTTAVSGEKALSLFQRILPDLVIIDIGLTGMDGTELFWQIKQLAPQSKVLFISGNPFTFNEIKRLNIEATYFLAKPFSREEFLNQVASILDEV